MVFKIRAPVGVKGIGCPLDLTAPLDFGFYCVLTCLDQMALPSGVCFFQERRKSPFATTQRMPVSSEYPGTELFRISAFGRIHSAIGVVRFPERCRCRHMAVVIGPASDDRVENADQVFLTQAAVAVNDLTHFLQEAACVCKRLIYHQWLTGS